MQVAVKRNRHINLEEENMWSLISALATLGFVAGVVGLSILIGVDPQIYHLERTAPSFILGLVVAGIVGAIIEQIRGGCK